jgi:Family of unknown function (DUF5762)
MQPEKYIEDSSNNEVPIKKCEKTEPGYQNNDAIIPFWAQNPNVLFQKEYIMEFFPVESMTYEQKLNAITRTILLLTILGFAFTRSIRLLLISLVTFGAIFLIHYYHELENKKIADKKKVDSIKEGFEDGPALDFYQKHNIPLPAKVFQEPDSHNPFSNVLMTDYEDNPNKKPAPPAFNKNISQQILNQAKKTVMETNPDQPDIADKLFKDLGEQLVFEQSLRPFHSTSGTTIPNDQGAFAEFCYGSMVSCKEGNAFACASNMTRYNNY